MPRDLRNLSRLGCSEPRAAVLVHREICAPRLKCPFRLAAVKLMKTSYKIKSPMKAVATLCLQQRPALAASGTAVPKAVCVHLGGFFFPRKFSQLSFEIEMSSMSRSVEWLRAQVPSCLKLSWIKTQYSHVFASER